jgi:hypothetical protein
MIAGKRFRIEERFVFLLAGAAACTGCAANVTRARAPSPANGEVDPSAPLACTIEGSPRVVATKASPLAGVEAVAESSRVWLHFSRRADGPLGLAIDPESLQAVGAADSTLPTFQDSGGLAPAMWLEPAPAPGLPADSGSARRSSPVVVPVGSHRSVWVWTEGSTDTGLDVRILTVGRHGEPLGPTVTLRREGSAIGRPAVAVSALGLGVLAFLESNGQGFQVVAASLDCAAPEVLEASESWSSTP